MRSFPWLFMSIVLASACTSSPGDNGDDADTSWHYENPSPDNRQRMAVASLSANDVWAVGAEGLVEHWDGSAWHDVPSNTTGTLSGVWAAAANDVWIVGAAGTILHWNGSELTKLDAHTTRDLYDVNGTGSSDVWIVGDNDANALYGLILHWNGSTFQVNQAIDCPNTLYTVYAKSATDVWVGGAVQTVCHFNGSSWASFSFNDSNQGGVTDIWRSSTGTVWAIYDGDIWSRDGATWTFSYALPQVDSYLVPQLGRLAPISPTDMWASGSHGFIVHWNGSTWTPQRVPGNADYYAITSDGQSGWAVGPAARAQLVHGTWAETYKVITRQWLWSTSGASGDDLWSLGSMGDLVHRTTDGWAAVTSPLTADDSQALYAPADHDMWLLGDYKSAHWDGQTFTVHSELSSMRAMWGTSSDLWAVGDSGSMSHYDGTKWTPVTSGLFVTLLAVAGTGPKDVWAVGSSGMIAHYDGTSWTRANPSDPDTSSWSKVLAIAPDDVWVTGESKNVRHWNGSMWTSIPATTTDHAWISDGWVNGPNDIWFVESGNALLHWDGTAFTRTDVKGASTVIGFAGKEMWMTGQDGWIQHRNL